MKKSLHSFSGPEVRIEQEAPKQHDLVFVRELFVKALTGVDAWHRPQPQPVSISIWLQTSVAQAGSTDHLVYSLNYDAISRKVTRMVEAGKFKSLEEIADNVANEVLKDSAPGQWCKIHVKKPRALLRAGAAEIIISRKKKLIGGTNSTGGTNESQNSSTNYEIVPADGTTDVVLIQKLQLTTIIGVNTIERMHKQNVVIDLTLYRPKMGGDGYNKRYDFRACVDAVESHVEDSSYKTVEAFVTSVAEVVCRVGVDKVTVRAEKPSAITFADAAGVEITRDRSYFKKALNSALNSGTTTPQLPKLESGGSGNSTPLFPQSGFDGIADGGNHTVYIAFGSNVGDCVGNIRAALHQLGEKGIKLTNVSSLYESFPMFVTDQNKIVNGVVKAETKLKPLELLDALKDIEYNKLNRVKVVEKGPRTIDLDILLYDELVMNHPRLDIPHVGMLSRSFVLQPLVELVSSSQTHPLTAESYHQHLDELFRQESDPAVQVSSRLSRLIPLTGERQLVVDPTHHSLPTQIMAILNVTPDSFSDGGKTSVENVVSRAKQFVAQGATILDVGGMSTSPNSTDPGEQEEMSRVVPAIKALRQCEELANIAISIDTYRSSVARAAIEAGADIINDISAGAMDDPAIFATAKELQVPIVLNHTRGTPQTMNKLAEYTDTSSGDSKENSIETANSVLESVATELEARIDAAVAAGIPRWQLILDPGIGFAKHKPHNLAIVRYFNELVKHKDAFCGLPWLVGPSRKRFIGTITNQPNPSDRVYGTAAAVTAMIAGGADMVRVHDVDEMRQVVRMADAIYKDVHSE